MAFGNFYYQSQNPVESSNSSRSRRSYDGPVSSQNEAQIYSDILRRHSNPTTGPSAPSYEDIFSSLNSNDQSNNQENLPKNFLELEHLDNRLRPPFISHSNPTTPCRNRIMGIPMGHYDTSESALSSRDNYYSTFAMNVPEIRTYIQYIQDEEQPCCSSSTSSQRRHSLNQDENVRLSPTWTCGGSRESRQLGRHQNQNHRHSPRPRVPSPLIFNYDLPEIMGGNENVDNEREEENNDGSGNHNLLSTDSDDPPSYEECIGQIETQMQGLALRDTIF